MPEPFVNERMELIHKRDAEIRAVQAAARKVAEEVSDKEAIKYFEKHYKDNARLMFNIAKKLLRFGVREIGFHTMFCSGMNNVRNYLVMTRIDPDETMQELAKGKDFRSRVAKEYLELVQMFLDDEEFKKYGYNSHWFSHLNFDKDGWREKWIEWIEWVTKEAIEERDNVRSKV